MTDRAAIEAHLARMALGDREAFAALYAGTSAKLFGVCLRVLGNRAEAEDALQDAYFRIWTHASKYQVNGLSPMTWLITVTRNLCIDRLRARRATGVDVSAAEVLPDSAPGPEAQAIAGSERAQIAACMDKLEPDKSEALRRAYLEGETYKDLSDRFSVPLNTMRTWLRRSLIKLRECLGE